MTEPLTDAQLGAALADLGPWIATPEHSLATRVRASVADVTPARTSFPRWLVPVAAVIAIALALVTIAPTREAIADLLGIGSTSVEPVDVLPKAVPTTLPPAGDAAAFRREMLAAGLSAPDAAIVGDSIGWTIDRDGESVVAWADVVLSQRRLSENTTPSAKQIRPDSIVASTLVDGEAAFWIEDPHTRTVDGTVYESTSALLWIADQVEYRLEGDMTLARAEAIAASVAPMR